MLTETVREVDEGHVIFKEYHTISVRSGTLGNMMYELAFYSHPYFQATYKSFAYLGLTTL